MTTPLLWWLLEPASGDNPGSGRDLYSSPGSAAPTQKHANGRGTVLGFADTEGNGQHAPIRRGTGTVIGIAANHGDGQAGPIDADIRRSHGIVHAVPDARGSGTRNQGKGATLTQTIAEEDELLLLGLI